VSFSERFNNRVAIDKALKQAQADVQYVESVKALMQETLPHFRAILQSHPFSL
jgi:hypothetical protein